MYLLPWGLLFYFSLSCISIPGKCQTSWRSRILAYACARGFGSVVGGYCDREKDVEKARAKMFSFEKAS